MRGYLGIDQSLNGCGLCLVDEDGRYIRSSTLSVGRLKGCARLDMIVRLYDEFVSGAEVLGAASEGFSVNSTNRPFDLGGVAWVLRLHTFRKFNIEPSDVPPTSLKLYVAGTGSADKEAILYTVKTVWGVDLGDRDDEADAFGLARFAWSVGTGRFERRCEAESVHALSPTRAKPLGRRVGRSKSPNV